MDWLMKYEATRNFPLSKEAKRMSGNRLVIKNRSITNYSAFDFDFDFYDLLTSSCPQDRTHHPCLLFVAAI